MAGNTNEVKNSMEYFDTMEENIKMKYSSITFDSTDILKNILLCKDLKFKHLLLPKSSIIPE